MIIYWEIIYLHRVHDIHGTGIFTYIYHTKINHSCIFGSYDQGHGHPPLELQNSGNQRLRLIAFHVQVIPTYPTGSMYVWYIYLREWLIFYGKCRKIYPSRWIFWVLGFMLLDNRHAFWIFSLWHTMFCSNGLGIQRLWDQICWNVYGVFNYLPPIYLHVVWALNGVNPKNSPPPAILNPGSVSSVFRTWQPKSAVAPHSMKTCQNLGVRIDALIWDEWLINLLGDYGPHDLGFRGEKNPMMISFTSPRGLALKW